MALRVVASETAPRQDGAVELARESFFAQARVLTELADRVDIRFREALDLVLACSGRVIVCGVGKSGLIGRKLAATFACSGTPSFFLHPGEAAHGDLGAVTCNDLIIAISNSGETSELIYLLPHFRDINIPIIALVGRQHSHLARAADVVLDISVEREACPYNLVPTTSALATLAMGDALAMAAMRARGFQASSFARLHPGGSLGARLSRRVRDTMRVKALPTVSPDMPVGEALVAMTAGRCGLVIVVDEAGHALGIVTDGDLRRGLQEKSGLFDQAVSDIMTPHPVTISEDATLYDAEERMRRLRIKALIVVDVANRVSGIIEIFGD